MLLRDFITCVCAAMATMVVPAGCSAIDEDLSDCSPDVTLDYELQLVTNMTTELQTELRTETDVQVASALRQHLSTVFTDFAHDVDLSFYDIEGDSARLHHEEHVMDASQSSYQLFIPRRLYMHTALANLQDNSEVSVVDDDFCHTARLLQTERDTVDSHQTGLFTARQAMELLEGVDQTFNVHLYMANCAAALVIDPRGHDTGRLQVYSTGFATGFSISDSVYVYPEKFPVVRTSQVSLAETGHMPCYCSVTFPSREPAGTRAVIETSEPFIAEPGETTLWQFKVYMTQADGSVTETILGVKEPLRAGQLKIIKCWLGDNGAIQTEDSSVGLSVTLNWDEGGHHVIEL